MRVLVVLAIFLSTAGSLPAALEWEARVLELRPALGAATAQGEFRFTNIGRHAATISSIETECGCTTAALEKRTFEPGEKGRIAATFTVGERTGKQSKQVYVYVKGAAKPVVLTLAVQIPEALALTPNFVYWQVGASAEPKTISVAAKSETPVAITAVSSSSEHYRLKLETVRADREYRLIVMPQNTEADTISVLTVTANVAGTVRVFHAYAQVKPIAE